MYLPVLDTQMLSERWTIPGIVDTIQSHFEARSYLRRQDGYNDVYDYRMT